MSSKNKTSKTARVMNLLSNKAASDSENETAGQPVEEKPAAPVPPVVSSIAPDVAVSVTIRNALEDELDAQLEEAAPAPQPEPEAETVSVQIAAPEPEPVEEEPAPAPAGPVSVEEPIHWKEPLLPQDPGYINVMQVLVEEKAPKYIRMFGLCDCARCLEDVKAYTLNHLPPKYVVLEPGDRIPRLTVYEGRFSSDITAQLLQACKVVHATPHHSRT